MKIEYVFKCPTCAREDTIPKREYDWWGDPFCEGDPPNEHKRVTMKRHYTVPTVSWPRSERGH